MVVTGALEHYVASCEAHCANENDPACAQALRVLFLLHRRAAQGTAARTASGSPLPCPLLSRGSPLLRGSPLPRGLPRLPAPPAAAACSACGSAAVVGAALWPRSSAPARWNGTDALCLWMGAKHGQGAIHCLDGGYWGLLAASVLWVQAKAWAWEGV